ncbi:MAG: hypothetical protein ABWX84_10615 [Nocardioides sp.]
MALTAVELLALISLSMIIGALANYVAARETEGIPLFFAVFSAVVGTTVVWVMYRSMAGEANASGGMTDWPHWIVSLLGGTFIALNAVLITHDI